MGNKNTKEFEYNDFLQLIKQQNKQEIVSQQILQQQYKCMIVHHNYKSIEGICMNQICKQQNRRTCFDCISDGIHDKDHGKISLIKNADQSENIIKEFKDLFNQQMDNYQFQFYFQQLKLCDESNDNLAYIRFKELKIIDDQIQQLKQQLAELNFQQYLSEQQQNNIGLFQHLQNYHKQITSINEQLIRYKRIKKEIKSQPKKFLQSFQADFKNLEEMKETRKKQIYIIELITRTNKFRNTNLSIVSERRSKHF